MNKFYAILLVWTGALCLTGQETGAQVFWDSSFHEDGRNTAIYGYNPVAGASGYETGILSSGSTLAVSTGWPGSSWSAVHLFYSNGHRSAGFGTPLLGGVADIYGISDIRTAMHRDTLYMAGITPNERIAVMRMDSAGTADPVFGPNYGVRTVPLYANGIDYPARASAVAVQPDGKILLGAWGDQLGAHVIRLKHDGSRDSTFGVNGDYQFYFPSCGFTVERIFVRPNGKICVAGNFYSASVQHHFSTFQLRPDGTLDSAYGVNGLRYDWVGTGSALRASALQPDGKLVLAGTCLGMGPGAVLIRYKTNGTTDSSFGTNGLLYSIGINHAVPEVLAADSLSRVHILGRYAPGGGSVTSYPMLIRLREDGTPDSSFNGNGIFSFYIDAPNAYKNYSVSSLHLLPDSRILAYGSCIDFGQLSKIWIGRIATGPRLSRAGTSPACAGDTATLICHAGPGAKRWYRNGVLLPDTGKMLRTALSGSYTAVNTYAPARTDSTAPIILTFHPRPVPLIQQTAAGLQTGSNFAAYQWHKADHTPLAGITTFAFQPAAPGEYYVVVTDSNGCSASSSPFNYQNLEVPTGDVRGGFRIYPNPAVGSIIIENNTPVGHAVLFMDGIGRTLRRTRAQPGTNCFPVGGLTAEGAVWIRIEGADGPAVRIILP